MSDLWPYFPFPTISTVVLLRTCSTSSPVSVHYHTLSFFIIYKAGLKAVNTINALSLFESIFTTQYDMLVKKMGDLT